MMRKLHRRQGIDPRRSFTATAEKVSSVVSLHFRGVEDPEAGNVGSIEFAITGRQAVGLGKGMDAN